MTETTIGQAVEGPQPTLSVAELLRAAYEDAAAAREPKDIQIYGYGEPDTELHVLLRMVDDLEEISDALRPAMRRKGVKPTQRQLDVAIDTLLLASVGSYAVVNGERHDLGVPLGLELYDQLFPDDGSGKPRPATDRQAVVLLFHNKTLPIATAFVAYDNWVKAGGVEAEEEALGE